MGWAKVEKMEEDKRYLVIGQREHSIEIWGGICTKIINSTHPPRKLPAERCNIITFMRGRPVQRQPRWLPLSRHEAGGRMSAILPLNKGNDITPCLPWREASFMYSEAIHSPASATEGSAT